MPPKPDQAKPPGKNKNNEIQRRDMSKRNITTVKPASTTALGSSNNVFQAPNGIQELRNEFNEQLTNLKSELKAEMVAMRNVLLMKDEEIRVLKKELEEVKEGAQFISNEMEKRDLTNNENLEKEREHLDNIHNKIWEVQDKTRDLEDRSRRDNLVFRNIPEAEGKERETGDDCERKLKTELNRCYPNINDIKFERVHRLGRKKNDAVHPRLIIAKFSSHKDRQFVINNSKNLAKRDNINNITVNEDFSEDTVAVRRQLWTAAKAAQNDYQDATYIITHVKLVYRRVVLSYKNKSSDVFFSRGYSMYDIQKPGWYTVKTNNSGRNY
jgi:hypothetical protein